MSDYGQQTIGWIMVHRGGLDHDFFVREPVTEWEAWVRLIARAAWKETRHKVGGKMHVVPRGTFFATLRELRDEFHWRSAHRVKGFLDRLKNENMIETSAGTGKTRITICNYDKYQNDAYKPGTGSGTAREQDREQRGNTKEKDKNIPVGAATPPSLDKVLFDTLVPLLVSAGSSERSARSLVGKWKRDYELPAILEAYEAARNTESPDPAAFITATLSKKVRTIPTEYVSAFGYSREIE